MMSNTSTHPPNPLPPSEGEKKEDSREEWEIQRDSHKASGDAAFRSRDYASAVTAYTAALSVDPDNHLILSNRSAAYLAKGEKSRALADARACVEAKPDFAKGRGRLAAAVLSLGRYGEAREAYKKVLELDPGSAVATRGLESCRRGEETTRESNKASERRDLEAKQRRAEEEARKREEDAIAKRKKEKEDAKGSSGGTDKTEEDDLLDDFFSEVETTTTKEPEKNSEELTKDADTQKSGDGDCDGEGESNGRGENKIRVQLSDLGTSSDQISRLLAPNHEFRNLNPFLVLSVPRDAPGDVITSRYRALSLLLHPDKCPDPRAKEAFEYVRVAMQALGDEDKARHVKALVDGAMKNGKREWELAKSTKGKVSPEEGRKGLEEAQQKAVMKVFADIEMKRRDVEKRKRAQEQRERDQEDEEKKKEKDEREFDKKWRQGERVDKRVTSWRDFQSGPKKKKS